MTKSKMWPLLKANSNGHHEHISWTEAGAVKKLAENWSILGMSMTINKSNLKIGFPINILKHILKPTANWSPYIFTLVQKVKYRVYKINVFFLSEAMLCRDSASYFIEKWRVLLARTKLEKRYPHFKKSSHFFYDKNHYTN